MNKSDAFRRVKKGDRIAIPATAYNAMLDAAVAHRQRQADISRDTSAVHQQADIVLVRNDSGSPRQQFDILGIDGPIISPDANETEFRSRVALKGVTPGESHVGKFVVLAEPLANGKIGKAFVAGACPVKLSVDDDKEWRFAECVDSEAGHLEPAMDGSAAILWREGGTGVQWAIVRLGQSAAAMQFGKPTAPYSEGETIELDPCDASGESLGLAAITVQAGWDLPNGCEIETDQVIPYTKAGDGYHAIGMPKEIITAVRLHDDAENDKITLQKKIRQDFGLFHSSQSDWVDADDAVTTGPFECPEDA